jgi:hypothetical protein
MKIGSFRTADINGSINVAFGLRCVVFAFAQPVQHDANCGARSADAGVFSREYSADPDAFKWLRV